MAKKPPEALRPEPAQQRPAARPWDAQARAMGEKLRAELAQAATARRFKSGSLEIQLPAEVELPPDMARDVDEFNGETEALEAQEIELRRLVVGFPAYFLNPETSVLEVEGQILEIRRGCFQASRERLVRLACKQMCLAGVGEGIGRIAEAAEGEMLDRIKGIAERVGEERRTIEEDDLPTAAEAVMTALVALVGPLRF